MKKYKSSPVGMGNAIRESYRRADTLQRLEGIGWYPKVRAMAARLADKYNRPLFQVVGVIAALSPRNKFGRNMVDAECILRYGEIAVVATFGANKRKALAILSATDSNEVVDLLSGKKVTAFYNNIMEPNGRAVTIDVWMLRLMGQKTSVDYDSLAGTIRYIARELGLKPAALQAITWVESRGAAF